jgi:hypothetical protein
MKMALSTKDVDYRKMQGFRKRHLEEQASYNARRTYALKHAGAIAKYTEIAIDRMILKYGSTRVTADDISKSSAGLLNLIKFNKFYDTSKVEMVLRFATDEVKDILEKKYLPLGWSGVTIYADIAQVILYR